MKEAGFEHPTRGKLSVTIFSPNWVSDKRTSRRTIDLPSKGGNRKDSRIRIDSVKYHQHRKQQGWVSCNYAYKRAGPISIFN